MSGYYRRVIANRILRTLSKHGKLAASEIQCLERNVALLIRTDDIRKKQAREEAQYRVDIPDLVKLLGLQNSQNLEELLIQVSGDEIKYCKLDKTSLSFCIDCNEFHQQVVTTVQREGQAYGSVALINSPLSEPPERRTVVVEYSSPNIAKPFHAGHLRSTIIGNFIANLYQLLGHRVHRINYLGDWGTQFGLLALGFQRYGDEHLLTGDPLLQLFKMYVQINQDVEAEKKINQKSTYKQGLELFTKLEQGDPEMIRTWKHFRQLSLDEYSKMYQRLGVNFTEIQFESEYGQKAQEIVMSLQKNGLLKWDEHGVGYMTVDDRGAQIKATLVKSDGSSLYLGRDVAAAVDRQERFSPDKVHYVVEGGQQLHFRQLVGVLRQMNIPWASRPTAEVHIQFGRIEGMSSRRGTVVFLRDILDEARDRLLQSMKDRATTRTQDLEATADTLAVSAVAVQDLKARRQNNYIFSWDRMLSFSADSGIFVQYAHARLCSLLASCGSVTKAEQVDFSCLQQDSAHHLLLFIARYPELVEETLSTLEPCHVVQYLFKLCHLINGAYSTLPVKGEALDVAQARLVVFDCARQVLNNGMRLIGLQPLQQM